MNRFETMLASIHEDFDDCLKSRAAELETLGLQQTDAVRKRLRELIRKDDQEEEGQIVISYLRSSYITRTHQFKIAVYHGEPFLERPLATSYYSLSCFFEEAERDLESFRKKLGKSFVNIRSSEIEEIRRRYMEALYQAGIGFFGAALEGQTQGNNGDSIFFGEEMGELTHIGMLSA